MDWLVVCRYFNLASLFVGLITALILASRNLESKDLSFSVAALSGTIVMFFLQSYYQFRDTTQSDEAHVVLTVDRQKPEIRQSRYPSGSGRRVTTEVSASKWLVQNHPETFDSEKEREQLNIDLAVYSFLNFIGLEFPDWQMSHEIEKGLGMNTRTSKGLSSTVNSIGIDTSLVSSLMKISGNRFAGAPLAFQNGFRLPPRTLLEVGKDVVSLWNPFVKIEFKFLPSQGTQFTTPNDINESPQLSPPGSGPRYETRDTRIKISSVFFGLRNNGESMLPIKKWHGELIAKLSGWFKIE